MTPNKYTLNSLQIAKKWKTNYRLFLTDPFNIPGFIGAVHWWLAGLWTIIQDCITRVFKEMDWHLITAPKIERPIV